MWGGGSEATDTQPPNAPRQTVVPLAIHNAQVLCPCSSQWLKAVDGRRCSRWVKVSHVACLAVIITAPAPGPFAYTRVCRAVTVTATATATVSAVTQDVDGRQSQFFLIY